MYIHTWVPMYVNTNWLSCSLRNLSCSMFTRMSHAWFIDVLSECDGYSILDTIFFSLCFVWNHLKLLFCCWLTNAKFKVYLKLPCICNSNQSVYVFFGPLFLVSSAINLSIYSRLHKITGSVVNSSYSRPKHYKVFSFAVVRYMYRLNAVGEVSQIWLGVSHGS